MYYRLVTVYTWFIVFLFFILFFPIAAILWVLTILFDKRLKLLHLFSCFWASMYIFTSPFWSVQIINREKIKSNGVYVMICNHQSMLDIIVLYRLFAHYKWVAKKELFKVPIVGWNMVLNRYVAVDRGNKSSHLKMFNQCQENLKNGSSIMIFPEGTRSEDGEIHNFKDGAFKIALTAKVPILPIVLDGTSDLLPKHGFVLRNMRTIKLKVLDPVPYESFETLSARELTDKMRSLMVEEFQKLRQG